MERTRVAKRERLVDDYSPKLTDSMPRNSADWPSSSSIAEELVVFGDAVGAGGAAGF